MRRAALHNLGCKVNSYETEAMQQMLEQAGYEIVPFSEEAEVYVVNTCSVTNIADRKSRQMLHRAKKMNPKSVVVAVGCYVQAAGEKLKSDEAVDLLIGNNKKTELVNILEAYFAENDRKESCESRDHIIDIGETGEYEELHIERLTSHSRAFIKVQDGCNQFCSYCIIPYTRGRVRSRKPEDVEREIVRLVGQGYREVVLTGIHLSSYGMDLKEESLNLLDLIVRLHRIDGLARIRLGSLEPRIVTEEFTRILAGFPKICPHFHLSLQSGCDTTLKRMNRRYNTSEYEQCCRFLREAFSYPAITTDVIVGFPDETEAEFLDTRNYLSQIEFYEMHIFQYSKREGTKAAAMPNQIPEQMKSARSESLLELGRQMSEKYRRGFPDQEVEVLLEEKITVNGQEYWIGYTKEYIKAAVPFFGQSKNQITKGILSGFLTEDIMLLK